MLCKAKTESSENTSALKHTQVGTHDELVELVEIFLKLSVKTVQVHFILWTTLDDSVLIITHCAVRRCYFHHEIVQRTNIHRYHF